MDLIGRSYEINALADPHTNLDVASSIHSKPCPVPGCIADGKNKGGITLRRGLTRRPMELTWCQLAGIMLRREVAH